MSQQNGQQGSDQNAILYCIILVIGAVALWFFRHDLMYFFLTIKLWQLKFLYSFVPLEVFKKAIDVIENSPITDWDMNSFLEYTSFVGMIFNSIYAVILAFFTYSLWDKSPYRKFRRKMDMNSLRDSEKDLWPYIYPVLNQDILSYDLETGPYAMAAKPYNFCVNNNLLENDRDLTSLNKVKAEKIFINQLDRLTTGGFKNFARHERVIIACCIAQGLDNKKEVDEVVGLIAKEAASLPLNRMPKMKYADKILRYLDTPEANQLLDEHSYVKTLIMSCMMFAQRAGVFPSLYFIWLKPRDRLLWYTLNVVGRRVSFVEVAGIVSHYQAERSIGHSLYKPYVEEAVNGLVDALQEVKLADKKALY